MASLVCTSSTESSLSFRLEEIQTGQSYGKDRTFTFTCGGESITKTVSSTSTSTYTGTAKFTGLDAGTEYTCVCSFTDSHQTYTWECDASTESSTHDIVCSIFSRNSSSQEYTYDNHGEMEAEHNSTKTLSEIISGTGVYFPENYTRDYWTWNGTKTTATSWTIDGDELLKIYITSSEVDPTTEVEVQTWYGSSRVDTGSCIRKIGYSYSVEELIVYSGVTVPSGKVFESAEDNSGHIYSSLSSEVTIIDGHVLQAFYVDEIEDVSLDWSSYKDTSVYKTGNKSVEQYSTLNYKVTDWISYLGVTKPSSSSYTFDNCKWKYSNESSYTTVNYLSNYINIYAHHNVDFKFYYYYDPPTTYYYQNINVFCGNKSVSVSQTSRQFSSGTSVNFYNLLYDSGMSVPNQQLVSIQYDGSYYNLTDNITISKNANVNYYMTGIYIVNGGQLKDVRIYANNGGSWKGITPYVCNGGSWKC